MEKMLHIPLTTTQLAALIRQQLPLKERLKLASLLQQEDPAQPSLKTDLQQAVQEVNLAKAGKLTLPTLEDFLNGL